MACVGSSQPLNPHGGPPASPVLVLTFVPPAPPRPTAPPRPPCPPGPPVAPAPPEPEDAGVCVTWLEQAASAEALTRSASNHLDMVRAYRTAGQSRLTVATA